MDQLGVGDKVTSIDLFATPWTTAAPIFITKEMDSFSYDWGALLRSEEQILWANPPFALLSRVVAKLEEDACRVVLITPEKKEQAWWQPLSEMAEKSVTFPPRSRLFMGGFRKDPLPQKDWRTVAWLVDTTGRVKITVTTPE